MKPDITNFRSVFSLIDASPHDDDGPEPLHSLVKEAYEFVSRHSWCQRVVDILEAAYFEDILAIFFFNIQTKSKSADPSFWVIVGDVPPAYLQVEGYNSTPKEALEIYTDILEEWVDTVRKGDPVDDMMPIYVRLSMNRVPATKEYADALESRIKFIRSTFLPELSD